MKNIKGLAIGIGNLGSRILKTITYEMFGLYHMTYVLWDVFFKLYLPCAT